ncbi:uracil phosphoribosyltransferase [Curtobacterium sp. YC1]|uniref:uracil phosphoribosyltransferase n=1 Tax=Curtobacterium sp. YC1 TaxID=2795488 RepID=UPI0018E574C7|nr:uracil phosphoribosyltransferase [Curtobacterium sp. YC1]QQD76385.1 uracil phosphoribosyltransferase [Curtobacterium sp. YC1]
MHELPRTDGLVALHATARDVRATHLEFVLSTQRIMRLLLEEALGQLQHTDSTPTTPIGATFPGRVRVQRETFAVSVPRAGDALEAELRSIVPDARLGKILIQRDPQRKVPVFHWSKLPDGIAGKEVLLLDPMMATAGTVKMAVSVLAAAGVRPADIVLVNFLTCPEALGKLFAEYPEIRVVTSFVDEGLTEQAFMRPGIGDFGDRYYGTHG